MVDLQELAAALQARQAARVKELTEAAIAGDIPPAAIVNDGLVAGMNVIGRQFKNGEIFLPEVMLAARAMQAGLDLLRPLLAASDVEPAARIVLGTVKGDLHEIGKNLVGMMLEGAGFAVVDLGYDIPPAKFVAAIQEHGAGFVGMSALLTTTMPAMQETIESIKSAGLREQVKVLVGGAPVTQEFADRIGADGFASDAATAVDVVRSLL